MQSAKMQAAEGTLEDLLVFLVEPSTTQGNIIKAQFAAIGVVKFEEMKTGAEALLRVRETQPDVLIAAMHLPDMTSLELVQALRADGLTEHLQFLLISSITAFADLDPIRQAGATAILPKPFNARELKQALYSTLDYLRPNALELANLDVENLDVLIVDDSRMARKKIMHTLGNMGIEKFTEAGDGREAVALIDRHYYDLIVTDYNMPNMDGGQLVDYIRNNSRQSSVPILMVTTEGNRSKLQSVQRAGVSAICDKTFDPANVKATIEAILAG